MAPVNTDENRNMSQNFGRFFHALVDGEQTVVYPSIYDLPKNRHVTDEARYRYAPKHTDRPNELIPEEADVKLGEAVGLDSRIPVR